MLTYDIKFHLYTQENKTQKVYMDQTIHDDNNTISFVTVKFQSNRDRSQILNSFMFIWTCVYPRGIKLSFKLET
jgi:hypothetical protein